MAPAGVGGGGCSYADEGSGPLAAQLCWLDFSPLGATSSFDSRTPVYFTIAAGQRTYTLTATLHITGPVSGGTSIVPQSFPTWRGAFLGNTINGQPFYTFDSSPGAKPALAQPGGLNWPHTTVALEDIQMVENLAAGGTQIVDDYAVVVADAESTDGGEWIEWETSGATFTELANSSASAHGNACSTDFWVNATSARCSANDSVNRTGTPMLYAVPTSSSPWTISQEMQGEGKQAVAFALMFTSAQNTVEVAERVNPTDQFTVTTTTDLNGRTAKTTSGAETEATVSTGPLMLGGASRALVTMGVEGDNLASYKQEWTCWRDSTVIYSASSAPDRMVTSIGPREDVRCTVTLTPAHLRITKLVTNDHGGALTPADWTMTASQGESAVYSAGSGTRRAVPAGTLVLGESSLEPDAAGYTATRWVCTSDGSTVLDTTEPAPSLEVVAGSEVDCTITNADEPGQLHWGVFDAATGDTLPGSSWLLTGPGLGAGLTVTDCVQDPCTPGGDQDPGAGVFTMTDMPWGDYNLIEAAPPTGYQSDPVPMAFETLSGALLSVIVPHDPAQGGYVPYSRLTGEVTWAKADDGTGEVLAGSTWTLTGPSAPRGTPVEDCVAASSDQCPAGVLVDTDERGGYFRIAGLEWSATSSYTLTEAAAPAGYVLDKSPRTFSILPDALNHDVGTLTNVKQQVPVLPSTGGTGAESYWLAGAGLLCIAVCWAVRRGVRRRKEASQ